MATMGEKARVALEPHGWRELFDIATVVFAKNGDLRRATIDFDPRREHWDGSGDPEWLQEAANLLGQTVIAYTYPLKPVLPPADAGADLAAAPSGEWRTFDSAPKDRTEILVYRPDAGVFTALYIPGITEDGEEDEDNYSWFTMVGEDLTGDLPTHWMPLPPGPGDTCRTTLPAVDVVQLREIREILQAICSREETAKLFQKRNGVQPDNHIVEMLADSPGWLRGLAREALALLPKEEAEGDGI